MSPDYQTLTIDFEIDNNGYKDMTIPTNPTQGIEIAFYKNDLQHKIQITEKGTAYIGNTLLAPQYSTTTDGNLYLGLPSPPGNICSATAGTCTDPTNWKARFTGITATNCPGGSCVGTIIARINGNKKIPECTLHNQTEIYCLSEARLRFYTIDYYTWVK
jgi:hypothetical protein